MLREYLIHVWGDLTNYDIKLNYSKMSNKFRLPVMLQFQNCIINTIILQR